MSELYIAESIPTACPYCGIEYTSLITGTPEKKVQMDITECNACGTPYVVRQEVVLNVTVHRIDGLQPVEPQIKPEDGADILLTKPEETACVIDDFVSVQCEKCGVMFVGQWGTLYCQKCQEELKPIDNIQRYTPGGTHPDPDTFLCNSCGTLNGTRELHIQPNGEKWCVSCIGKSMEDKHDEIPSKELQFTQIHGNVWAAISGESVHLKYGNSKCGIWDRTIFDTLLEMTEEERRKEIDSLIEGMPSKQQRKACLRQFVIALENGEVSFPEMV